MKYYLMPLTNKEKNDLNCKGYKFAINNRDRWVAIDDVKDEINTYDRGTTVLVHDDVVYDIFKDYINIDEQYRVYIGCDLNQQYDRVKDITEDEDWYWSSTNNNSKIPGKQKVVSGGSIASTVAKLKSFGGLVDVEAGTYADPLSFENIKGGVTISGPMAGVVANTGGRATKEIASTEAVISGKISLKGDENVTFRGLTFTESATIDLTDYNGNLEISNCKFVGLTKDAGESKGYGIKVPKDSTVKLNIRNNYFGDCNKEIYNGFELTGKLVNGSVISNNYITSAFMTHNAINIYNTELRACVYITNNYCENDAFCRIGLIGNNSSKLYFTGNKYGAVGDAPWNSAIIIQPYGKQTETMRSAYIEINEFIPKGDEAAILACYDEDVDTNITDKLPIIFVNKTRFVPNVIPF